MWNLIFHLLFALMWSHFPSLPTRLGVHITSCLFFLSLFSAFFCFYSSFCSFSFFPPSLSLALCNLLYVLHLKLVVHRLIGVGRFSHGQWLTDQPEISDSGPITHLQAWGFQFTSCTRCGAVRICAPCAYVAIYLLRSSALSRHSGLGLVMLQARGVSSTSTKWVQDVVSLLFKKPKALSRGLLHSHDLSHTQ